MHSMGTCLRRSVLYHLCKKWHFFQLHYVPLLMCIFLYCLCLHDHCFSIGIGLGHAYASAVCVLGLLSGSSKESIPVSSTKVHFVFLSCTILLYHHYDYWFVQPSHSCEDVLSRLCLWSTTYFSNDGVAAEDHVCFY